MAAPPVRRPVVWEGPIADDRDGAVLRLDDHGAHALIDGTLVSTPHGMDTAALVVALDGAPMVWHATVLAAQTVLDDWRAHAPQVPLVSVARAVRSLALPVSSRRNQAAQCHQRDSVAAWRTVVHSVDPDSQVRQRVAARTLSGTTGTIVLDRCVHSTDRLVTPVMARRPDVYAHPEHAEHLATHPDPYIRALTVQFLPHGGHLLRRLSLDHDPLVQRAINLRIDDIEERLMAGLDAPALGS